MKAAAPIHPIEIRIRIGANDKRGLATILRDLSNDLELYIDGAASAPNSFSGGWDGSYSITATEREISAEEYRRELELWRQSL